NAADPGNDIAPYSSRGPTNDGRTKPDITGIDGVSVTGAGGFSNPFYGTSAAGPHIAGIAALLLQCRSSLKAGEPGDSPSSDRATMRDALLSNAIDLGSPGVDNTYGTGRADALNSVNATCLLSVSTFRPWPGYGLQSGSWVTGDFNGDGRTDLLHLCCANYANLWLAQANGGFSAGPPFQPWPGYGMQLGSWLTGDFNGDGRTDLLHLCCTNYANVWLAQANGGFSAGPPFQPSPGYGMQPGSWVTGDFTGDGRTDLLHLCCANYANLWLAQANGGFSAGPPFQPWPGYGMQLGSWVTGDFNKDGKADLFHACCGDYAIVWLSQGSGGFTPSTFRPWIGYGIQFGSWRAGDFNGDGKTDLIHLCCGDYANLWQAQLGGGFRLFTFQPWPGYGL